MKLLTAKAAKRVERITMMTRQAVWLMVMCALSRPVTLRSSSPDRREIGRVGEKATFVAVMTQGKWGLGVNGSGMASVSQPQPVAFEFYQMPDTISHQSFGYDQVEVSSAGALGTAHVVGPDESHFTVEDQWTVNGSEIQLSRKVTVTGQSSSGFLTAIMFSHPETHSRAEVDYFAPGLIYGSPNHLSAAAIGGSDTYAAASHGEIQIREDRLPAPEFGVHFPDGSGLTVLDPTPNGASTKADSHDIVPQNMVDERYQFGALGVHLAAGHHEQGFWFPCSEGEFTYAGNTYPGGQKHVWRRRYHPIQNGLTQQYRVAFRFSSGQKFPAYYRDAWRWAYDTLKPPVTWLDISLIQRSIIDVLAS